MSETDINDKILKKLEKFSKNPLELKMCKQLLLKELQWFDIDDPPYKRDFSQFLNTFFPFNDEAKI